MRESGTLKPTFYRQHEFITPVISKSGVLSSLHHQLSLVAETALLLLRKPMLVRQDPIPFGALGKCAGTVRILGESSSMMPEPEDDRGFEPPSSFKG